MKGGQEYKKNTLKRVKKERNTNIQQEWETTRTRTFHHSGALA